MKYQFIQEFSASYPVRIMCKVLEVSPSGYYAWRDRPCSARQRQDAQLLEQLCALHAASREVYGSPRLLQALRQTGVACSRKRVIRLMRQAGLRSKRHRCRRRRCTTRRNPAHRVAPNLLQQRFVATAPHQVWLVDMSYIPTQAGWLYLAVVLDLYTRRIVGWAMDAQMTDALSQRALRMAVRHTGHAAQVHHSDRGSQYTSDAYRTLLAQQGMLCSMSGTGNCYDNAPAESFFATLKTELTHHLVYPSQQAAQSSIFAYIEGFYNRQRLHSALGYCAPAQFESQWAAAQITASLRNGEEDLTSSLVPDPCVH
jgi:transposase InsO family protein